MPEARSLNKQLRYHEYFRELAQYLGDLLLPLAHQATSPKTIVSSEALHSEIVKRMAIKIYRSNNCLGMKSPVSLFSTLDALGQLRYEITIKETTDTQSIDFLESVGRATIEIFRETSGFDEC